MARKKPTRRARAIHVRAMKDGGDYKGIFRHPGEIFPLAPKDASRPIPAWMKRVDDGVFERLGFEHVQAMKILHGPEYPKLMYHPMKNPERVENREQEEALGSEWTQRPDALTNQEKDLLIIKEGRLSELLMTRWQALLNTFGRHLDRRSLIKHVFELKLAAAEGYSDGRQHNIIEECWTLAPMVAQALRLPPFSFLQKDRPAGPVPKRSPAGPRKLTEREKVWRLAIRKKLKGRRLAQYLEGAGLKPPEKWIAKGCPGSYTATFDNEEFQRIIFDERQREVNRMNRTRKSE